MGIRLTGRRTAVAATACVLALGSAGAIAVANPDPLEKPKKILAELALELPQKLVEPIISLPTLAPVPVVPPIAQPAAVPTKPKAANAPKAAAQAEPDPVEEAVEEAVKTVEEAVGPESPAAPEAGLLGSLEELELISIPEATYGDGWSFCNGNNVEHVVNEGSHGSETDVDQRNGNGGYDPCE